jgi:hypothetical protein
MAQVGPESENLSNLVRGSCNLARGQRHSRRLPAQGTTDHIDYFMNCVLAARVSRDPHGAIFQPGKAFYVAVLADFGRGSGKTEGGGGGQSAIDWVARVGSTVSL